jgi:hypothetical protein
MTIYICLGILRWYRHFMNLLKEDAATKHVGAGRTIRKPSLCYMISKTNYDLRVRFYHRYTSNMTHLRPVTVMRCLHLQCNTAHQSHFFRSIYIPQSRNILRPITAFTGTKAVSSRIIYSCTTKAWSIYATVVKFLTKTRTRTYIQTHVRLYTI